MTLQGKYRNHCMRESEIGAASCGHCGLSRTPEGHDGCIGTLPGVTNACCGHGGTAEGAYVQFSFGSRPFVDNCLRDDAALAFIHREEKMSYKLTNDDIALEGPHGEDLFTLHLALKGFGGIASLQSLLMPREVVQHLHDLLGSRLAETKTE